jgi:hypothetical protein
LGSRFSFGEELFVEGQQIFETSKHIRFPHGYKIFNENGRQINIINDDSDVEVRIVCAGKKFAEGKMAYMSEWSFNRMLSGHRSNWIVENSPSIFNNGTLTRLPYENIKIFSYESGVKFPNGYTIFDQNGKILKTGPKKSGLNVRGQVLIPTSLGLVTAHITSYGYNLYEKSGSLQFAVDSTYREMLTSNTFSNYKNMDLNKQISPENSKFEYDVDSAIKWKLLGHWKDDKQVYHFTPNNEIHITTESKDHLINNWNVKSGALIWQSKFYDLTIDHNKIVIKPQDLPGPVYTLIRTQQDN